mgnify:CR=1 FL=1
MMLIIDVGNTNIMVGFFKNNSFLRFWRLQTLKSRTADEMGLLFTELIKTMGVLPNEVEAIAIACVVPPLTRALKEMSKVYFKKQAFFVEPGIKTGMPIMYDNPKEIGADRIVNAVAAVKEYGVPSIVIDFGTATTFDVISPKGEYVGGVIAPGVFISSEALFEKSARLPRVEITDPKKVIGKNTIAAMQSGIFYGYVGVVNEITKKIEEELETKCNYIATGGLAELIAPCCDCNPIIDKILTLKGIKILYDMNVKGDDQNE